MTTGLVTIESKDLVASINPLGAELWSLKDSEGRQLMTDADPRFWTGRAPILFPIVGGLANNSYRLGNRTFDMPKHGFARHSKFEAIDVTKSFARFRLEATKTSREIFPFEFRLDLDFELTGSTLAITATVTNLGNTAMPFSFGFHPAFAWPLPYGGLAQEHRIVFEDNEVAPVRRLDPSNGLLTPKLHASPVRERNYWPSYADFSADALIWDTLASRSLRFGVPGLPNIRIDYPDLPMLGIWQKPRARYLCIEPWAGLADPLGFKGDFYEKPGILILQPGKKETFRMSISLLI
jgi:galactose mutarotase-like enzyme